MAKIAALHNGTQIHFPDTTPDSEMDTAVNRHLNIKQPPTDEHKTHIIAQAAHVEATNGVAKAMQDILGPISGMADTIEQNTPEIIMAIDKLSGTIERVGSAIIKAMSNSQRS